MFGTALKAPGHGNVSHNREKQPLFDIYNDTNTIGQVLKIDDLKAEVVRTLEGNLTYAGSRIYASGTGFFNIIEDQIQRDHFRRDDATARKLEELSDFWRNTRMQQYSFGTKVETQIALLPNLRAWVNGSYTQTWDETENPLANVPPFKYNIGLNLDLPVGLNVFAIYKGVPMFTSPTAGDPEKTVDGIHALDMNLTQRILSHVTAEFQVANLLDQDFPQAVSEAYPGRNLAVTLSTRF